MRIAGVLPSNRRGELIGQEVVLCSERQMPRLFRRLHGRKRTGRLRGYQNHMRRNASRTSLPDMVLSAPAFLLGIFRAMYSHVPAVASRQYRQRQLVEA